MTAATPATGRLHRLFLERPGRLFWMFVTLHVAVWTLLPGQVHPNVPVDLIEGLAWGHEWRLGYYTHPPLQAWILEAYARITGGGILFLYFLSQLGVGICLWAVWRLAREMVDDRHALLAVLLLEGVFYYNYESVDFNPNTLQLPLWALVALFAHRAVRRQGIVHWALLGVFAALSVLAKYSAGFLLLAVFLFLVVHPRARRCFAGPGPTVALLVFAALLAPHLAWGVEHGFPGLRHALQRAAGGGAWSHLYYPLRFTFSQALALLPAGLLLAVLAARRPRSPGRGGAWGFDHWFVFALALGPFLLHLAVSAVFGFKLKAMWGTPLWFLAGLMAVMVVRPEVTAARFRRFAGAWCGVFVLAAIAFAGALTVGPYISGKPSRGHFPGPQVSDAVTGAWHRMFGRPLAFVSGLTWIAGNVAYYADERPSVYIRADGARSPWIDEKALRARGAVFVWEFDRRGERLPAELARRFPALRRQPSLSFAWRRPAPLPAKGEGWLAPLPPVRVGWAVLPPAGPP